MKIVLATRNPGKVEELKALLHDLPVELVSSAEIPDSPDVVEDGETLEANARKKALMLAKHTEFPALADDTGLEVDSLHGKPGVHSARFAGSAATDADNRRALLEALRRTSDRVARFRTVLAFAENAEVRFYEGICSGHITLEERGTEGFGYDSIFQPDGFEATFAQMSQDEKNAISHRGKALRAFAEALRARLGG